MDELALPLNADNLFDIIDEVVQKSVEEGDPEVAFGLGKDFITIGKRSGLALGRLAFMLKDRWVEFNNANRFEDVALQYWDVNRVYLDRLIRDAEMLQSGDIPEQLQETFEQMGIKELNAISAAWQEGDLESEEHWERLAGALDDNEVREIIRDIRDLPPRKHTLMIWMTRGGDLYCTVGTGEQKHVGFLNVDSMDDPDIEKAINRIINNSRISKQ